MVKSVITAAGKGTRLLPITKELPKEMMALVKGESTVRYPLAYWKKEFENLGFHNVLFKILPGVA